jgi:hypothetical protein
VNPWNNFYPDRASASDPTLKLAKIHEVIKKVYFLSCSKALDALLGNIDEVKKLFDNLKLPDLYYSLLCQKDKSGFKRQKSSDSNKSKTVKEKHVMHSA